MKRYCVIGERLGHTLSPQIHNRYYQLAGIDAEYVALPIAADALDGAREELSAFDGFNVTVPYKSRIMEMLDGIDEAASHIGAVNTVTKRGDKFYGANTDLKGFGEMLKYAGIDPDGKECAVLGTGGASKAVCKYLQSCGASVVTVSRTPRKETEAREIGYEELARTRGYLLVNTTPVGMFPDSEKSPVTDDIISGFETAADIVYNPTNTLFLQSALRQGKLAVGGLKMLVAQALQSERIWQKREIEPKIADRVYAEIKHTFIRREKGNAWLIGMMASGKSTLGRKLGERLGRTFVDADDYIERISGQSIRQLFERGESVFRDWERKAIFELSERKNLIVACGGGAILDAVNVAAMRLSGTLYRIDRSIERIAATGACEGRPLLRDGVSKLFEIYDRRRALYEACADITIDNNATAEDALNALCDWEKDV